MRYTMFGFLKTYFNKEKNDQTKDPNDGGIKIDLPLGTKTLGITHSTSCLC